MVKPCMENLEKIISFSLKSVLLENFTVCQTEYAGCKGKNTDITILLSSKQKI